MPADLVSIPISRACNQRCRFCDVADQLDRRPVDPAALRATIDAARARGAPGVVFTGGEPLLSGQIIHALAYAHGLGLRTAIATHGRVLADPDKIERIAVSGLDEVRMSLHGAEPATHRALIGGDPVAWDQVMAAIRNVRGRFDLRLRTVLVRSNAAEIERILALAAEHGAVYELRHPRRAGAADRAWDALALPDDEARRLLEQALRAAERLGVDLRFTGFPPGLQGPARGEPAPLDPVRLTLLRAGIRPPSATGGVLAPEGDDPLAVPHVPAADSDRAWAARGVVVWRAGRRSGVDPAPAWAEARRIAVVVDRIDDPWLAWTALPGLAHALGDRGALHTPFRAPWSPEAATDAPKEGALGRLQVGLRSLTGRPTVPLLHPDALPADASAQHAAWLAQVDPAGADVVLVTRHASVPILRPRAPGARFVVWEQGLLDGWAGAAPDLLVSATPGLADLYAQAGVPLDRVLWSPAAAWPAHTPLAADADQVLVVGGEADAPAPGGFTTEPGPRALPAAAAARAAALARCRVVWLGTPATRAAVPPARWVALALATGRALVGPAIPALDGVPMIRRSGEPAVDLALARGARPSPAPAWDLRDLARVLADGAALWPPRMVG